MSDLSLADDEEDFANGESNESDLEADADEGEGDAVDGDQGEDDEEDGAGSEEGDGSEDRNEARQVERKPNRGAERFKALSERTRAAEERAERAEREAVEARRIAEQRATKETEQEEQLRISVMSDVERFDYLRQKDRREFDQRLFAHEFRTADAADRTAFESKAARNPALAKIADEVESVLRNERSQNRNPTRETVAAFLIGKRALERAGGANTRQGKKAAVERQRQVARPAASRGDVSAERRGGSDNAKARAKRLEGLEI